MNLLIEARVDNRLGRNSVFLSTNGNGHSIEVRPRSNGFGSIANGGELLCLALATCYGNDVYREAEKRGIAVVRVEVEAEAEFGAAGDPTTSLRYRAHVHARGSEEAVRDLMTHTDRVAEVQNTLRRGIEVRFQVGRIQAEV